MSAKSDRMIRDAVVAEFDWNSAIDASQLGVDVNDGVVTLVGTVPSIVQKLRAQAAAEAIDGVRDVLSRIDVKITARYQQSDRDIEHVVSQVLAWDALVPEQEVSVAANDGWVTLRGSVPTRAQAAEAERAVNHLAGIRGVTNEIGLSEPDLAPDTVRSALESALERRAAHRARKIDVIVDGHLVVLRGTVESIGQRRAIYNAVSHAPGVDTVCDELRIELPRRES